MKRHIYFSFTIGLLAISGAVGEEPYQKTLDEPFQVRYASNLTFGDSMINITNSGANGAPLFGPGFGTGAGNICVNVYAFSPDEQLISCCSCPVTPNGLVNLTANRDLVSNTLTGIRPSSIVIKLVATATGSTPAPPDDMCVDEACAARDIPTFTGNNCTNSAAMAGTDQYQVVRHGMLAWGTTLHSDWEPVHPDELYITETPFLPGYLSYDELKSIRNRCANILGNGSTFGQCRSCKFGGLGGAKL